MPMGDLFFIIFYIMDLSRCWENRGLTISYIHRIRYLFLPYSVNIHMEKLNNDKKLNNILKIFNKSNWHTLCYSRFDRGCIAPGYLPGLIGSGNPTHLTRQGVGFMGSQRKIKSIQQIHFNKDHDMVRRSVADFVKKEINPYVDEWEEAGIAPLKELFKKMGDLGFLAFAMIQSMGARDWTTGMRPPFLRSWGISEGTVSLLPFQCRLTWPRRPSMNSGVST